MIENWIKNHSKSDNNHNITNLYIPKFINNIFQHKEWQILLGITVSVGDTAQAVYN